MVRSLQMIGEKQRRILVMMLATHHDPSFSYASKIHIWLWFIKINCLKKHGFLKFKNEQFQTYKEWQ